MTCVSGAIVFAVIGALMAIVNTTLTPVETIAGRTGLFLWNSLSSNSPIIYLTVLQVNDAFKCVFNCGVFTALLLLVVHF